MATVFVADDAQLGRRVAIKVLHPDLASSLGAERFAREIRVLAQLNHPHVLPVLDSGVAGGILYYVMPFVDGESLRDRLDREHQIPIDDAIALTCEIADALSYAHSVGIVHRDIKPENILVSGGHAVVADFGIARLTNDTVEKLTMTGMSMGTAAYMSPEQASGEPVDGRADLYSLGCLLYELLVGEPPFSGPNAMAVMARHAMETPPGIRVVRTAVPEELEAVVMQALEKSPADRFRTVGEFKRALLGEANTAYTARYTARYSSMRRTTAARRQSVWLRHPLVTAATGLTVTSGVIAVAMSGGLQARAPLPENAARVAVTYFTDAPGSGLQYLADALTENVIQELGSAAVDVVSAGAVRAFRGGNIRADSIGKLLDVGTLVRGSVEPYGDSVRVKVQLWDAVNEEELDSRSFNASASNPIRLQGEVASRVADLVRTRIGQEVTLRREKLGTSNGEAWTAFRRAELRRKEADSLLALGRTQQALAALTVADSLLARSQQLDERWSIVHTRRAQVALTRGQALRGDPPLMKAAYESGLAYAERALALEPQNPDALNAKGDLLYYKHHDRLIGDPGEAERTLAKAETTLKQAVRFNRDQAGAWSTLSALYYRRTDLQGVVRASYEALRADRYLANARTLQTRLFYAQYNTEDFTGAMNTCDEGRKRFPSDPNVMQCRLFLYMTERAGRPDPDSAWIYASELVSLHPEVNRPLVERRASVLVAGALVAAGLPDSARRVLDRARPLASLDPTRSVIAAEAPVRVMLGEKDRAIDLIREYLAVHPEHKAGFRNVTHWWWRPLQEHPRFRALISD